MSSRNKAAIVSFTVCLCGLVAAAAQEPDKRPANMPFYTWVREDAFGGFIDDDMTRFERSLQKVQEYLKEQPNSVEASNWSAASKVYLASRAFKAGDHAGGDALFAEGMALMDQTIASAPRHIGLRATTGGTLAFLAPRLPERHYRPAMEKAREHYAALFKAQESMLSQFPLHLKGEALAGAAETEFRVGDRTLAVTLLNRIVTEMPGTPYAKTAETWLQAPEAVTRDSRLICQSCHQPGRLQSWMARQPK